MDRDRQNSFKSSSHSSSYPDLTGDAMRQLVHRKARRLVARAGLPASDLEDVAQFLYESLIKARATYDPQRGDWLALAERTLQNAGKVFNRNRSAAKRDVRRSVSLNISVHLDEDTGSTELAQLITEGERTKHRGVSPREAEEAFELREDVASLIANLPTELAELVRALMADESVLEISRRTSVPRTSLYYQLERVGRIAGNLDLAKYL